MEPQQDPKPPSRKRRKMLVACNPCRARKTGCDGGKPCTCCSLRGWQDKCNYQERDLSSQAQTLANLSQRVQQLEKKAISNSEARLGNLESTASQLSNMHLRHKHGSASRMQDPASDYASDVVFGPDNSHAPIFGQSACPSTNSETEGGLNTSPLVFLAPRPSNYGFDLTSIVLPTRSLGDSLLQCYWDLTPPIFPILHRPTFEVAYSRVWSNEGSLFPNFTGRIEDVLFYATLNIVLSLGAQRDESLELAQRKKLAEEFYSRSLALISVETLDISSLEVVQLFLLRGLYLLYTTHADRCWNVVGAAIRVAQGLGLNNVRLDETGIGQLTREMRRRVWCNCVSLDRIASHTFGRYTLMPHQSVRFPAEIDDEYLFDTHDGQQPIDVPSRMTFFVYNLRLYGFLARVDFLETRSGTNSTRKGQIDDLAVVLDINSELDEFLQNLPNHLCTEDDVISLPHSQTDCFKLQAQVLKSRVLYSRLALLRGVLIMQASQEVNPARYPIFRSMLQAKIRDDMSKLCLSTAHEVLITLHERLATVHQTSAWHALYFAFAAASILVAAMLCPNLNVNLDINPGKTSWEKAIQIFKFHQSNMASAGKGITLLETFRDCIEQRLASRNYASNVPIAEISRSGASISGETMFVENASGSVVNSSQEPVYNFEALQDLDLPTESWFTMQDFQLDDWVIYSQ